MGLDSIRQKIHRQIELNSGGSLPTEEYENAYKVLGVDINASTEDIKKTHELKRGLLDTAMSQIGNEKKINDEYAVMLAVLGVDIYASTKEIKKAYEMKRTLLDMAMSQIGNEKKRDEYDLMLAGKLPLDQQALALKDVSGISTAAGLQENYKNLLIFKDITTHQKEMKQRAESIKEYITRYKEFPDFLAYLEDLMVQLVIRSYLSILLREGDLVPPIPGHHCVFVTDYPRKVNIDLASILYKAGIVDSTQTRCYNIQTIQDTYVDKISSALEEAAGTVLKIECSKGWNTRVGVKGLQTLMELIDGNETFILQLTVSKEEHKSIEEDGSLPGEFLKAVKTFYLEGIT